MYNNDFQPGSIVIVTLSTNVDTRIQRLIARLDDMSSVSKFLKEIHRMPLNSVSPTLGFHQNANVAFTTLHSNQNILMQKQ